MFKNASVKDAVCQASTESWSTTHGIRGILALLLFASEHSASLVLLRPFLRDPRSLKQYQHTQRSEDCGSSKVYVRQVRNLFMLKTMMLSSLLSLL